MRPIRRYPAFLILLPVASCGLERAAAPVSDSAAAAIPPAALAYTPSEAPPRDGGSTQLPTEAVWAQQKLIRSGDLMIQVADVERALARADTLARAQGGMVADLQASRVERDRRNARLTIRVPAERFGSMMESLKTLGDVKHETAATEDVTKAYADLETRLAVKERTAARLQRLLADRTGRLSDVLEVERELGRVITEIEQMKGERRYYDSRIAVSTITVALFEPAGVLVAGPAAPLAQAFRHSLQVLSTSAAWLVYLLTVLAPWAAAAGAAWGAVRLVRRRHAAGAR